MLFIYLRGIIIQEEGVCQEGKCNNRYYKVISVIILIILIVFYLKILIELEHVDGIARA